MYVCTYKAFRCLSFFFFHKPQFFFSRSSGEKSPSPPQQPPSSAYPLHLYLFYFFKKVFLNFLSLLLCLSQLVNEVCNAPFDYASFIDMSSCLSFLFWLTPIDNPAIQNNKLTCPYCSINTILLSCSYSPQQCCLLFLLLTII